MIVINDTFVLQLYPLALLKTYSGWGINVALLAANEDQIVVGGNVGGNVGCKVVGRSVGGAVGRRLVGCKVVGGNVGGRVVGGIVGG